MNCPQCGAENPDGAKFCIKCGASLVVSVPEPVSPPPVTECPVCKVPRMEDAKFCSSCGHRFDDVAATLVTEAPASVAATTTSAPLPDVSAEAAPVIPAIDAQKDAAPKAPEASKGNNTTIVIIIVVLLAIIAAAGAWYLMGKDKVSPVAPPATQSASMQASTPSQPGMPAVDANGMPIKQSGADAAQPGQPAQPGMPQVDANGMPIAQPGQAPAQSPPSNVGAQQPVAQPAQDMMPEPMPQEARKRRAKSEAEVQPQRRVRAGGSVDQQYEQRAATECPSGGGGFFCREKIRYQLCNGRWSENPPPGQIMCRKAN